MNSLSDLNNYGGQTFTYTDERARAVTFTNTTAHSDSILVLEGDPVPIYLGTDIRYIINDNNDVYFKIQMSTASPVYTWTWTIPSYSSATANNYSQNDWIIGPLKTAREFRDITRNSYITVLRDYVPADFGASNISYISTVQWGDSGEYTNSWTTTVVIQDTEEISTPGTYSYTTSSSDINPNPNIIDTAINDNGTYIVNVSVVGTALTTRGTITGNATGGTANTASGNYYFTANGNICNQWFDSISYTPNAGYRDDNLIVFYTLTNPTATYDGGSLTKVSTVHQAWTGSNANILTSPSSTVSYYEDIAFQLTEPQFIDSNDGTGTYTMVIQAYPATSVNNYSSSSSLTVGTSTGTGGITVTGVRANVNDYVANMTVTPTTDYADNFVIEYAGTTMAGEVARRQIYCINAGTNIETGNLTTSRTAERNTPYTISSNGYPLDIPEDIGGTYTVSLTSSSRGDFRLAAGVYSSSISYTGTRANVNTWLSTLVWYPAKNQLGDAIISYRQSRDGTLQTDSSFVITVGANTSPLPGITTYNYPNATVTSATFSPTEYQCRYLDCNITVGGANIGSNIADGGMFQHTITQGIPYDNYGIINNFSDPYWTGRKLNLFYKKHELNNVLTMSKEMTQWERKAVYDDGTETNYNWNNFASHVPWGIWANQTTVLAPSSVTGSTQPNAAAISLYPNVTSTVSGTGAVWNWYDWDYTFTTVIYIINGQVVRSQTIDWTNPAGYGAGASRRNESYYAIAGNVTYNRPSEYNGVRIKFEDNYTP